MAFDYKKEYRAFYLPKDQPEIVEVPEMQFAGVRGRGDPNQPGGAYQAAVGVLYALAYTIKMSPRSGRRMEGFFDYVVPPLEGFWWQEGAEGVDYARKEDFQWVSCIRLPDFVTPAEFAWAAEEASRKKQLDCSRAELLTVTEGLCVQCMHLGPYDGEPATVARMDGYARAQGYVPDVSETRRHHEIYLSDARRCAPEKLRTVLRHPVRRVVP